MPPLGEAAMVTDTAMLGAIGLIYDAGLDPAAWPVALEHVASMLGANSAAVGLLDPRAAVVHAAHVRADPQAMADGLDRVAQAVLLVDARARVVHANRSAAELLGGTGGLDTDAAGLRADRPSQTRALHDLVARASAASGAGDIVLDRADGEG